MYNPTVHTAIYLIGLFVFCAGLIEVVAYLERKP